ncbi:MAG: arsenate reductase ArsC [Aquificota bacterium]|nr:arsenate reductase ArsC [Aquificota bacterium]
MGRRRILFLCTHNSARSIMAEAIMRHMMGDAWEVHSAGTEPSGVNPVALKVLEEAGIDTDGLKSKSLEEFTGQRFDVVVTLCDSSKDACPHFPGADTHIHRPFPDPSSVAGPPEEKIEAFRKVRDEISRWLEEVFGEGKAVG